MKKIIIILGFALMVGGCYYSYTVDNIATPEVMYRANHGWGYYDGVDGIWYPAPYGYIHYKDEVEQIYWGPHHRRSYGIYNKRERELMANPQRH